MENMRVLQLRRVTADNQMTPVRKFCVASDGRCLSLQFTNPKLPMRRKVEIQMRLKEGKFPCDWTAKVAGRFFLRAVAVDANGHEYFSDETPLEVMFPSYDQIVQDGTVILKNAVDTNRLSHTEARRHRD